MAGAMHVVVLLWVGSMYDACKTAKEINYKIQKDFLILHNSGTDKEMVKLQIRKAVICTGCELQIAGEYIVLKKNSKEEFFHPQCAKSTGMLKLPVQIRFTQEHNEPKNGSS